MTTDNRIKEIQIASWIAIIGNAILAIMKIVIGLLSGSLAVIGDGIDSSSDVITSFITLITSKIISKPPDMHHPYGHTRAETIATKILAFVIFFAGAQLALSTLIKIIEHEIRDVPSMPAIYVTLFSITGKLLLAYSQNRTGKKVNSSMLIANGKNMQNDVLISIGVLIGLFFSIKLELPIFDVITAFIVSILIIKSSVEIFIETNMELMDGINDPSIYNKIFEAVFSVEGVHNPHRTRVRKLSNMYVIDLDIEVNGELTVLEAHEIAKKVEKKISENIDNIYDIIVHIEPLGNVEHREKFGLSNDHIKIK